MKDKVVLKLIRASLIADNGRISKRAKNTPQEGPLSPLLSNRSFADLSFKLFLITKSFKTLPILHFLVLLTVENFPLKKVQNIADSIPQIGSIWQD